GAGAARARGPPFPQSAVEPLFPRLGCNRGACHGRGAGQNGFRLSLRGYAPELDYQWLTREYEGRRISRAVPEASLLLRKPLGQSPHEAGKLVSGHSREHEILRAWIRACAPRPQRNEPPVR